MWLEYSAWARGGLRHNFRMRQTALALLLWAPLAPAQMVENTLDVASYATVLVSNGQHKACGMRFTAMDPQGGTGASPVHAWALDLRVMRGPGHGNLVGLVTTELDRLQGPGTARTALKVRAAWFLQEGTPFSQPVRTGPDGGNGPAALTIYDAGVVLKALADTASDAKPHFLLGIQLDAEQATRVYRFSPRVKPADATEFVHCASALINQELGQNSPAR